MSRDARMRGAVIAPLVFNYLPAAYAHPSWYRTDEHATCLASLRDPSAMQAASRWLLQRHGLEGLFDFDTACAAKRVAWSEPSTLWRLAVLLGAIRYCEQLCLSVEGGLLRQLGAAVGERAVRAIVTQRDRPALFPTCSLPLGREPMPQLLASGLPCLFAMWPLQWQAVRGRVRLKFPRGAVIGEESFDEAMQDAALACVERWLPMVEPR